MKKQTALDLICTLLILLFVYTAVNKLLNHAVFIKDMHNQPFAGWVADAMAWLLPPFELIIAGLLAFNRTRAIGLYAAAFLMLAFTVYTVVVLLRFFTHIPCGCGGFIRKMSWPQHLVFNLFFTAMAITGILLQHKNRKTQCGLPANTQTIP